MKRSHLLHPATILGAVALVVVLAGSVHGATTGGSATIGSAQITNGSITLADISPRARTALRGARGPAGAPGVGTTGAAGQAGTPGTARAYGYISSSGVLDPARSRNLTVFKRTATGPGNYCVTPTAASGVTRSAAFPVVSADFTDGPGSIHLAQFVAAGITGCEDGWVVVTDNFAAGAFVRDDIAFSIVVP